MIQAPDLPRERRRPGGRAAGGPAGLRVPAGVQQGRRRSTCVCYRRRGHNEGDDPSMTNPKMYQIIDGKRSVRKIYTEELIGRGDITRRAGRGAAARLPGPAGAGLQGHPRRRAPRRARSRAAAAAEPEPEVDTAVDAERARAASARRTPSCPRASPRTSGSPSCSSAGPRWPVEGDIDWGFAEILAFGSLVDAGRDRAAVRSGLAAAARSSSGTRPSWTPSPATTTCRSSALARPTAAGSSCTTRC